MMGDRHISLAAGAVSVLFHAALFVQFTNTAMSSQAQAPRVAKRVSLNLLPPTQARSETETNPPRKTLLRLRPEPRPRPRHEKVPFREQSVAPKAARVLQRKGSVQNDPTLKQRYLSDLLTHIESYKYYPSIARRQGLKGNVQVSFELLGNGNIDNLKVSGGPLILRRAAKGAVNQALPLPRPPLEINVPMRVSYAMQFQLH